MTFPHAFMADALRGVAAFFGTASVSVRHVTGRDDYAAPTYGSATTFTDARIEGKVLEIRTATQETRYTSELVYLNSSATFNPDDEVTLPSGDVRLVLAVEKNHVGEEIVETVLWLGEG